MRSASTSRPSRRRRATRRRRSRSVVSRSVSGRHSLCQAPAARSCSWTIAASSVATRPGACCAQPSAEIAATGLCLCGIEVEPPPRPSRTSPTSVWASSVTSRAALPTAPAATPSAPASSPIRPRSVCHGSSGASRPRSRARWASDARVAVQRADRAAELRRERHAAPGRRAASSSADHPARGLQAERRRHGLLEQRAADDRRVAVRAAPAPPRRRRRRAGRRSSGTSARLVDEHRRGVDRVLARRAVVHRRVGQRPSAP